MQVYGPSHVHGPQSVSAPHGVRQQPSFQAPSAAGGDEVQISSVGQLLGRISEMPDIRQDKVQQLRALIAQGTYDSESRLSSALDKLLEEIG